MIIGMMFCKNEADILPQTLEAALPHVDSLFIADDGSTDSSWDIIKRYAEVHKDKIEHIQRNPNKNDPGQRNALLNEMRRKGYGQDDWVQIIEADIMILDTDVAEAIQKYSVEDLGVSWQCLNAVNTKEKWPKVDTFPFWGKPLAEVMPFFHRMEHMLYTFRLMPAVYYGSIWRPWPQGWSRYSKNEIKVDDRHPDSPLLLHVGWRGPTHFRQKFHSGHSANVNGFHKRYANWDMRSNESVLETVSFFNGNWNSSTFTCSRAGWINYRESRS